MYIRIILFFFSFIFVSLYSLEKPEMDAFSLYAIFFFINIAFDFFLKVGSGIPIKQLILLIAYIQWAIAPILSYHYFTDSVFYYMQIPESQYMGYIFPALLFFTIGLFIPISKSNDSSVSQIVAGFFIDRENLISRGKFLFYIGLASTVFGPFFPTIISFALFLTSKLTFIGAFYLFAVKVKYKYLYLLGAFMPIVVASAQSSVFHDMFLWGGFLFIVYGLLDQIQLTKKLAFVVLGIVTFLFVQVIKQDYRGAIRDNVRGDRSELLAQVASDKLDAELDQNFFQDQVDRLNQGWIIARIMYVVPTYEPYADGETINTGLASALLPRFLLPNKVVSGGFYFERFTGIELIDTSMNLGLVGEAYANYGELGGIIFMLVFGLFINFVLSILFKKAVNAREFMLWIPFLFLYMIKAEDDFTTMINQFVKALYIMIGLMWLMNRLYPRSSTKENGEEENLMEDLSE